MLTTTDGEVKDEMDKIILKPKLRMMRPNFKSEHFLGPLKHLITTVIPSLTRYPTFYPPVTLVLPAHKSVKIN